MRVAWGSNKSKGDAAPGARCPVEKSQHSLAQALIQEGAISEDALHRALEIRDESGGFLGEILIENGSIGEDSLTAFLAKFCRVPHLSLLDYLIDDDLIALLPKALCLEHRILPVDKLGKNLTVAMVNPLNQAAIDAAAAHCPDLRIRPVLCTHTHFNAVAERLFGKDAVPKETGPASVGMEDFGFTPFDADDGEDDTDIVDGEAVVTEIMSSFDEEVDEEQEAVLETAVSEVDALLETMRESMRGTYTVLARRLELFNGLSPEAVAKIFASGITVELAPGEVLFEKGDAGRELFVVLRGAVEIRDGETHVATVPPGEVVGETGWVYNAVRTATAVAKETTSLITLSDEIFNELLSKENAVQLLMNIILILTTRIRDARAEG